MKKKYNAADPVEFEFCAECKGLHLYLIDDKKQRAFAQAVIDSETVNLMTECLEKGPVPK